MRWGGREGANEGEEEGGSGGVCESTAVIMCQPVSSYECCLLQQVAMTLYSTGSYTCSTVSAHTTKQL